MIYNIMSMADLHWGVMDSDVQTSQYKYMLDFLRVFPQHIDIIVICGDYFDTRMMLGSSSAIAALEWMDDLLRLAKEKGVNKVRLFKGTKEHDNNQLAALKRYDDGDFFRIFEINTVEETLPGLKVIYCPEENMLHEEYVQLYADNILSNPDIGFFHGNWDIIMPTVALKNISNTTLVYEYAFWDSFIKGPMISGHWHDGCIADKLHYIGTPDRWSFGEDEPKGFAMIAVDTDDMSYYYKKIINPNSPVYISQIVSTEQFSTIEEYQLLMQGIDERIKEIKSTGKKVKVSIIIHIDDDKSSNNDLISHVRNHYLNSKTVKIVVKNKLQKKRKKEEQKQHAELSEKFKFINDPTMSQSKIIQQYIIEKKGREIELDKIESIISKYIQKG